MSSTGNSIDYGDLTRKSSQGTGISNQTRFIMCGGSPDGGGTTDTCDYNTIASTGNSVDFGNLVVVREAPGACASPTRGVLMGGIQSEDGIFDESQGNVAASSDDGVKYMRYVTFSTLGSSQHFGELSWISRYGSGTGSSTRGICVQGSVTGTSACTNNIDYITIASTGNGADFGDLTVERNITTSTGSQTRAVIAGGQLKPSPHTMSDTIDYIQIATTGNATDFGNLTDARWGPASASDVHGGIG